MTTPTIEPGYEIITPEDQVKFGRTMEGDQYWSQEFDWRFTSLPAGSCFVPFLTYRRRTAPAEGKGETILGECDLCHDQFETAKMTVCGSQVMCPKCKPPERLTEAQHNAYPKGRW